MPWFQLAADTWDLQNRCGFCDGLTQQPPLQLFFSPTDRIGCFPALQPCCGVSLGLALWLHWAWHRNLSSRVNCQAVHSNSAPLFQRHCAYLMYLRPLATPSLSQRFVPGSFSAKAGSGPYQLGQHFWRHWRLEWWRCHECRLASWT